MPKLPEDPEDAWASIVANFGERAHLSDRDLEPDIEPEPDRPREFYVPFENNDGYQPPPAPHVGLPQGPRGVAWLILLGVPVLLLVALLLDLTLPRWLTLSGVVGALASLGYLIATMGSSDDDPWDDGARV